MVDSEEPPWCVCRAALLPLSTVHPSPWPSEQLSGLHTAIGMVYSLCVVVAYIYSVVGGCVLSFCSASPTTSSRACLGHVSSLGGTVLARLWSIDRGRVEFLFA